MALTEEQEDALRKIFNRVDASEDGYISVIEAIRGAPRRERADGHRGRLLRGYWASTT